MGNWIETIIIILVIVMYIITWVSEPRLSAEYTKSFIKSGKVVFDWVKGAVKAFTPKGNTTTTEDVT